LAGIAGALYVPQVGIINPGEFAPLNSIELVVWVATGGRGTLFGAIVGAFTVNYGKTIFTSISPESWLFVLGALFVLVTLVLPKGLVGLWSREKKSESSHEALAPEENPISQETSPTAAEEKGVAP
jgi:urea transport system permease protein